MNCSYQDILSRIDEAPTWWDENAVPRFRQFHPLEAASIYAEEVALVEIACQGCGEKFHVAISQTVYDRLNPKGGMRPKMSEGKYTLSYGDPPNIPCCDAGPTMTSISLRIVEFWSRTISKNHRWERFPELEVVYEVDLKEDI